MLVGFIRYLMYSVMVVVGAVEYLVGNYSNRFFRLRFLPRPGWICCRTYFYCSVIGVFIITTTFENIKIYLLFPINPYSFLNLFTHFVIGLAGALKFLYIRGLNGEEYITYI